MSSKTDESDPHFTNEQSARYRALELAYEQRVSRLLPWLRKPEEDGEEQAMLRRIIAKRAERSSIDPTAYISPDSLVLAQRINIGARTYIASGSIVRGHNIRIGNNTSINANCHIAGGVSIGSDVRIGSGAAIYGFNHGFSRTDELIRKQKHTSKGIIVGDDVWIGANAVITDGCKIGDHAIIAGGAVVTADVDPWMIVGGNPARVLRDRRSFLENKN